jgi:hypothetical protein
MKTPGFIVLTTVALLIPSAWVFLKGAGDEPYMTFRASDAIVQIGVASALMALWLVLVGFVTTQVVQKRLHPGWLATYALCALVLCALYQSPAGYISDLVYFGAVAR